MSRLVRIGGGSAFFIDSAIAVPQLLAAKVDYIVLDYLAEAAMGLLGRMRIADPASGFPSDFLDVHVGPLLGQIAERQVRIVANSGGVNPAGLAARLRKRIAELGLPLTVACIAGDDLMDRAEMLRAAGAPDKGLTSANAYLGAFPIAEALGHGADIVITGRVVDSALALGPLIHEFGWGAVDWDLLAAGTVAGHLIECGAQVTGGTFTDWRIVEGWANIGSPIAECASDGSVVITKPAGTGGLVGIGTVAEQLLYEVGDPQAYFVPDVTCDFSTVRLEEVGPDRVRVTGATGYPPPATLKACATYDDGWRAIAYQPVIGPAAVDRARKQADAMFERGRLMLRGRDLGDFRRSEAVLIGAGESIGPRGAVPDAQEIVLKLIVEHDEVQGAQMFAREQFAAISAMAPGTSVAFGTQVQPCMHLFSFPVGRDAVAPTIDLGDGPVRFDMPLPAGFDPAMIVRPLPPAPDGDGDADTEVPLERVAWARSGEKGETINIAVVARHPDCLPWLRAALCEAAVARWYAHLGDAKVTVYDVPGISAVNIVLDGALPGGINASQRLDPAAKSVAQQLMRFPVPVPTWLA